VSDPLKRLDRAVYNVERTIVVTALVVMSIVVFLDVVHRTFSGEGSKLASAIAKIAGMMGRPIPEESEQFQSLVDVSPYIVAVVSVVLGYAGVRTARRAEPIAPPRALVLAVGGVVVVYGLIRLLVVMMPNGFIWSQPLALLLTLWVGFVGASMCTYENKHLKVEAVQRHIPPSMRKWVAFASAVATALFCAALLWLSIRYVRFNYEEYRSTDGQGGLVQGLDMPKWIAFMALPIAFAVMTARFLGVAGAALAGRLAEADPLAGLVDEATKAAIDANLKPQSDIPTEAIRAMPEDGPLSSSRMRQAGGEESGRRRKPSEVVTDRHEVSPTAEKIGEAD
jgi:TRAP-type C4-dicarboxylate transport system permease small subunit